MVTQETLSGYLSALRAGQGNPTVRKVASELSFSYKTAAKLFKGEVVGRWATVQELVAHLDGDEVVARSLWEAAKEQLAAEFAAKRASYGERRLAAQKETNRLLTLQLDVLSQILDRLPQRP